LFVKYELRRKTVSKKLIIMTAAAGLVSFAGAFVFAWLTKPSPAIRTDESKQTAVAREEAELGPPKLKTSEMGVIGEVSEKMGKAMTEKQLKNLVHDVREKIREYDNKLLALKVREQRLQIAQDELKKDIEKLGNLQIELATIIASLKNERDKLHKSRLEVTQTEKVNLLSIAATYDKMDVSGASKILTNMCAGIDLSQMQDDERDSFDDAVKILYYMTERTKAKLLAELATSEPTLAAALCQRLKQIVEGN
jgi:hypothetical protein